MRLSLPLLVLATLGPCGYSVAQHKPHDESVPHVHKDEPKTNAKDKAKETAVDKLWRESDVAFHAGNYARAVELHRQIVALEPDDVESYSVASWLLWSMEKPADAIAFLEKGLKANPKNPEMWDAAGQHYGLQKRFSDSHNAYAKAVELSGKAAPMLMRRRYAHAAQHDGNLGKSIEIWRALVADFPTDAVNKNNLARVEKMQKEAGAKPTTVAALSGAGLLAALALRMAPKMRSAKPGN